MKYSLFFEAIALYTALSAGYIEGKTFYVLDATTQDSDWNYFHTRAFSLPRQLKNFIADHPHDPLIALIPAHDEIISPLDEDAPVREANRVALTWASIFYRFTRPGTFDLRIIQIPEGNVVAENQLTHVLQAIAQKELVDDVSQPVEERIKTRIFKLDHLLQEPLSSKNNNNEFLPCPQGQKPNDETPRIITPKFKGKNNQKKRILVTGGAGFIGSHFVKKLLEKNHEVIALDDLSCSIIENIEDLKKHPRFQFVQYDITRPFAVEGHLDAVVHLASVPSPEMYYSMPFETMATGLDGTKHCLELAREKNALFLFSSTSEVYGDPEINPQPENYPGNVSTTGKRSQYDQSKRGGETLVKLYFDRYHIDTRMVRIFNTYGPHMRLGDGRVVTNFIKASLENRPMLLFGGGMQTRSFAYVDDTVDGILKIFETTKITPTTPIKDRVFNIGNPHEFTVVELALKVNVLSEKYLGHETSIEDIPQPDATDPKLRCPDLTRSHAVLGFEPHIALEEGLEKTFLYFLNMRRRTGLKILTLNP